MSFLVVGAEMPKAGVYTCELGVLNENTAILTIYTPIDEPQRNYKLVPVPPHGRLIDADALKNDAGDVFESYGDYVEVGFSRDMIDVQPTIIEAEE